jgi:adenylate cyclase
MARVIANPGHHDERVYDLAVGATLIGRGRDSEIRVINKSLSRQHARIMIERTGRATIEDVGSKNGTFVDGRRVKQAVELEDGLHFSCGDVVFQYSTAEYSIPPPESMIQEISAEATRVLVNDLLSHARNRRSSGLGRPKLPKTAEGRLQVLLEVARLLSSPRDIERQLHKILDLVFSILDIDRVALIMIDEESGEFGAPIVESRREATLGDTPNTYSKHILNYVRERSVAALFSDAAVDPRLEGAHSINLTSVRSSMCAPLKPHDEVIGVLYVDNLTIPAAFIGEDLEVLSAFAAQAAIAIENARLYQRLQNEAIARANLMRFFPPTTVAQLLKDPKLTEVVETEVTALFCDISGFSQMSAQMEPRDVVALLNEYFSVITEVVFEHDGTLEKYIGDAVLAVWGAPIRRIDDAKRAVQAAVDMQEAISKMSTEITNFPPLRIHIGVNTGRVAAGNIGSAHYLQYATIGDATNFASRLCSLAGPGEIAIGVSTLERLGGPPAYPIDGPEFHDVKGRDEPVAVYKLRWDD